MGEFWASLSGIPSGLASTLNCGRMALGGIANTSGTRRIRNSSTSKPFTFALAKPQGRFGSFTAHARKLLPARRPPNHGARRQTSHLIHQLVS